MAYVLLFLSILTLMLIFQTIRKSKMVKHYEILLLNHIKIQNKKLDTRYAELRDGLESL